MNMTTITVDDYPRLKPYFKKQSYRLSCYSLPAIIAWQNDNYWPQACLTEDTLLIGADFRRDLDNRHLILPVPSCPDNGPEQLARMAERFGFDQYWFVPQCYLDDWGKDAVRRFFRITGQKIYDDYVYRTRDLADLKGNQYAKKRNLIKQFKTHYVDTGRTVVEPITDANRQECAIFLERWCEIMACGSDTANDLACEKIAVLNTLEHILVYDVHGLAVRIDGEVCAFGIGAPLTASMGVLHYEKAYTDIKGLYQYLDNICACRLFQEFEFINKESDMGISGLSKAKKSYHPVDMVESFKLTLK